MAEKSNKKIQVPKVESNMTMQQPKVKTNYYYKEHVEAANDQEPCIVKNDIKNRIINEDDHKVFCEEDFNQEEDYYDYKQFKIGYFLRSLSLKGALANDQESNSISRALQTEQNHHHFDLSGVGACEAPYSTYKISCYLNALSDAYNKQDDGGVCKEKGGLKD